MFTVYMHKNKTNGKVYIGYTGRKVNIRWGKNGYKYLETYKNGQYYHPKFAKAIIKYGWDNFEHIIIRNNIETIEEAHKLEQELIALYQATNDLYGYNMTDGGEGMSGRHPSEETRQKMSCAKIGKEPWNKGKKGLTAWNKGLKMSEETRAKVSSSKKGQIPWNKGKTGFTTWNKGMKGQYPEETLKKMTLANQSPEKIQRTKEVNSVPVLLVETNEVFSSITIASQTTGVNKGNIVAVCKGKRNKAGGYHWQYVIQ